jgi:hypothetical protein
MITENYDLYRTDCNSFGGGTIIGIKHYLKSRLITNFETHNFETVFCELIFKNTKYLLCVLCVYITPNPKSSHLLEFESVIRKIENNFTKTYTLCDANINLLNLDSNIITNFLNILNSYIS